MLCRCYEKLNLAAVNWEKKPPQELSGINANISDIYIYIRLVFCKAS